MNGMHHWKLNSLTALKKCALKIATFVTGLIIGTCALAYETELAAAQTAQGLQNPTMSFNLTEATDYSPGLQYLDLMKMMRPWMGHESGQWNSMSSEELRDGGFLDDDGWVREIPDDMDSIGTIWSWGDVEGVSEIEGGTFVLEYEGEGRLEILGRVEILSEEDGRIVFANNDANSFQVRIYETDPNGTGDYIRDISVVNEEYVDMFEAGAVFNPEWVELVQDSRELRFMNWMGTNNSEVTSWSEMQSVDGPFSGNGASVEDMVQLANETGVDPWFTMPHLADEEYIRNFAEYVRDNLDPNLTVRVEYSNEAWNFAFAQTSWLREQANEAWGESTTGYIDYYTKKSVEVALIWEDVFSTPENSDRLVNVLGTFAASPWQSERLLNPTMWAENEPDTYVDPSTVFEELATTTYFGSATMRVEEIRDELIAAVADPNIDANAWLAEKLADPEFQHSIPQVTETLIQTAQVAEDYGLNLVAYEGGQHVHHSFAVAGLTQEDIDALSEFMTNFVRSEEMAGLYQDLWDVWAVVGDGSFMQFTDIGAPSRWGSWGLYSDLTDSTPRSELLETLNATTTPWWDGAVGGEFRQQGVATNGTEAGNTLIGTTQEDYLSGMGGDDIIVAGGGNDGINGGDGYDRAVLSGSMADYDIQAEGDGYRVIGLDGSDFLINIEEIAFESGEVMQLDSGTVTPPVDPTPVEPDPVIPGPVEPDPVVPDPVEPDPVVPDPVEPDPVVPDPVEPEPVVEEPKVVPEQSNGGGQYVCGTGNAQNASALKGTAGADVLTGSFKRDVIRGGNGDDSISGGGKSDVLHGDNGWDKLYGNDGNDKLSGGNGNDRLVGGAGSDVMTGGAGADSFVFHDKSGSDVIQDFSQNDVLVLSDFAQAGTDTADMATMVGGNLTLTNGSDQIQLKGLDMSDLGWVLENIA